MAAATWMCTCKKSLQLFVYFCLNTETLLLTNGWALKDCSWAAEQTSQPLSAPLGSRAESAQCHLASPLMSCMLDVHWERSIVSETARANSCPLLWCLLMQLLSTQLRIPTAAVSISPAKADVVSAAHAQISCPHRCPPTPKSSFSLLAEQNSLLVLTRHLPCHTFRTLCWEPSWSLPGEKQGAIGCLITHHTPTMILGPEASSHQNAWIIFLWDPILTEKQSYIRPNLPLHKTLAHFFHPAYWGSTFSLVKIIPPIVYWENPIHIHGHVSTLAQVDLHRTGLFNWLWPW